MCGIDYLVNFLFYMVNFDYILIFLVVVKLMLFMRYWFISCLIICFFCLFMGFMLNYLLFFIEDNSILINKKKIEYLKN